MSNKEAKRQFMNVIKSDLNRWFEESDLDVEDLAGAAVDSIHEWLDEEVVGFEPDEG
jgi:hypothetical protein